MRVEPDPFSFRTGPPDSVTAVLTPPCVVESVRSFASRHGPVAVLRCPPEARFEVTYAELEGFAYDPFEQTLNLSFTSPCGVCAPKWLSLPIDERASRVLMAGLLGSGYLVLEDGAGASVTFWYDPSLPFTLGGRIAEELRQHRSWLIGRPPLD